MKHRSKVTIIGAPDMPKSNELRTGCPVPESGFYRVLHSQHRLPKEITLLFGQSFPRCSRCADPVYFEVIRPAPSLVNYKGAFTVELYELPELNDELLAG